MIQSVEIQNFLSHKKSILHFHPGVNVIIGKSEHGKSVIIRALRWAITNKPGGDGIRSWWGGDTSVSVTVDEQTITRFKNSKNGYQIEETILTGIGQQVPAEIEQAFNINEINIQTQFESHFLLSRTSGEVAAFFNKVAHLDVIDKATKNVKKWIKDINHSVEVNQTVIKQSEQDLEDLAFIDKLNIEVEVLEEKNQKLQTAYQRKASLIKQIDNLHSVIDEIDNLKKSIEHEDVINQLLNQYKALNKLKETKETLLVLIKKAKLVNQQLKDQKEILKNEELINDILSLYDQKLELTGKKDTIATFLHKLKATEIELANYQIIVEAESLINDLLSKIEERNKVKTTIAKIQTLVGSANTLLRNIKEKTTFLSELEIQYNQEYPDICPFCGSNVKHQHK